MTTLLEYGDLPDDPEQAFLELAKTYTNALDTVVSAGDDYSRHYSSCMQYLVHVVSAAKACELDILGDWEVFPLDDDFHYTFFRFRSDVDHYMNSIAIRHARKTGKNSVRLNPQEKETLAGYIEKMRQIIASSNLADERKEQIFDLLSKLLLEVNRDRTRFERITEYVVRLAGLSRHTAEEGVAPWAKLLLPFFGVLDDAKQDEQQRLPKQEERKPLPPPGKPNVIHNHTTGDEIPF